MSVPRARIKSEKTSLIGGIVVGIAIMVLWVALCRELGFGGVLAWGLDCLCPQRWQSGSGWPTFSIIA